MDKIFLYHKPTKAWLPKERKGAIYGMVYHPNPGERKEVIERFERIVKVIRTSFIPTTH